MATIKTKTKKRALGLTEESKMDKTAMARSLATAAYLLKQQANKATSDYNKKRKELLGFMKNAGITEQVFQGVEVDGVTVTIEAVLETPTSETVDNEKAFDLIGKEKFLQAAKMGKEAFINVAGTPAFEQCKVTKQGEENVTIREYKARG